MSERDARGSDEPPASEGVVPADGVDRLPLDDDQIRALTTITASGGLVVFPAETVYGLATDPDDADAVRRMVDLKQRDPAKPSSVLFWSVGDALEAIAGAPAPVLRAVSRLLPGPIGLIVPNPQRRFGPACGADPASLGIRVPLLGGRAISDAVIAGSAIPGAATAGARTVDRPSVDGPRTQRTGSQPLPPPIVQTSANLAGGPDPTTLAAVPAVVRAGADLILDAGERPGVPSTIVDLRGVTDAVPNGWRVVRAGPVTTAAITASLSED